MGRRMVGVAVLCALALLGTGCGGASSQLQSGGRESGAVDARADNQEVAPVEKTAAQHCTAVVTGVLGAQLSVLTGQGSMAQREERRTYIGAFLQAYSGQPEEWMPMKYLAPAMTAMRQGPTFTEALAAATPGIQGECEVLYP